MRFIIRPGTDPTARADSALLAAMGLPGGGVISLGKTHCLVTPGEVPGPNALTVGPRTRANARVKNLEIKLAGANDTPIVNPVLVVENWGQDRTATITLDGKKPGEATDIRQGVVTRANGVKALVVWIECTSTGPLKIGIE